MDAEEARFVRIHLLIARGRYMIKRAYTKYGTLESVQSHAGYALFRGVPYAKPPVGDLRWRAPEPPEPSAGVRVCDTYGPIAPQGERPIVDETGHPIVLTPDYPYPPRMDEDCLYLNIYTPAQTAQDRLPVFLYYHGGGGQEHYGSCYEYCGDAFCRHGVIQITINYRMNAFGYMAHPELRLESSHDASGNYGVLDQIQALKWVRENIAVFGGDPENITIGGQSAGGNSVQTICCSPLARGLFQRATIHSAPLPPKRTREEMEKRGLDLMESLGCSSITQMRALPWQVIVKKYWERLRSDREHTVCYMYADGYVLPQDILNAYRNGQCADVPCIMGCTIDEGHDGVAKTFGRNIAAGMRDLAALREQNSRESVFFYCFDRPQPGDDIGTPHSCDNRYLFGTLDDTWRPYEPCDRLLSDTMTAYWAQFARTGDPNQAALPAWTPYAKGHLEMHLNVDQCRMASFDSEAMRREEQRILGD